MVMMTGKEVETGAVMMTRGISSILEQEDERGQLMACHLASCLGRHILGDWGDVDEEDWATNDYSYISGLRILSAYKHRSLPKIWIITEADRSSTTILFPEEY